MVKTTSRDVWSDKRTKIGLIRYITANVFPWPTIRPCNGQWKIAVRVSRICRSYVPTYSSTLLAVQLVIKYQWQMNWWRCFFEEHGFRFFWISYAFERQKLVLYCCSVPFFPGPTIRPCNGQWKIAVRVSLICVDTLKPIRYFCGRLYSLQLAGRIIGTLKIFRLQAWFQLNPVRPESLSIVGFKHWPF